MRVKSSLRHQRLVKAPLGISPVFAFDGRKWQADSQHTQNPIATVGPFLNGFFVGVEGWIYELTPPRERDAHPHSRLMPSFLLKEHSKTDGYMIVEIGRASREEEDPQGPRQEASPIHQTFRQRDDDRWQAQGKFREQSAGPSISSKELC